MSDGAIGLVGTMGTGGPTVRIAHDSRARRRVADGTAAAPDGVGRRRPSREVELRLAQPEHYLAFAVLEDAVAILARGRLATARRRLFTETWDWVWSDDVSWPFSFRNLCEVLDVNVGRLRTRIARRPGPVVFPRPGSLRMVPGSSQVR